MISGCAGVVVKPATLSQRFDALDRSAINSSSPSELTLAFLSQRDMLEQWQSDPDGLISRLDAKYQADPGPGTLFALMELAHIQAKRYASQPDRAASFDLACAVYSYLFLFDPKVTPPKDYLRPNARLAALFHNRSLSRYILYARKQGVRFHPDMKLPMATGTVALKERLSGLPFNPEEFSSIHLAFEFAVSGLDATHSVPGLGVPLILVREAAAQDQDRQDTRFLSKIRQVLPATLIMRIETSPAAKPDGGHEYIGRLEIYDPMRVNSVQVEGMTVPLETDTTTPLAWMAANAPAPQGIKGLMDPEALKGAQGLYMLQPYQKDKIPVVFVHGLISSPLTWLPMINGLMSDPELRERYQFWYFSYPTGNPVLYSEMLLRESLLNVRNTYDPDGTNPAFNNMLIVGHSMGGLLAKAMVQDSGDKLWDAVSKVPPSELPVSEDVRKLVEKMFFFKPLPFVTEAVFISAPHRGSGMALGTIGAIGRKLVTLPFTLAKASASLLGTLATFGKNIHVKGLPTGIDGLSPKNPVLTTSADMPVAVPFHSIIGNESKAGVPGGTDGVVPYWSSHLEAAQTELIVKSGHGAHEHPLAIREVRRIMKEHALINREKTP
ncbi:MAG: alpha/beta hydrolase [Desulfovibrio sp.]|nr:alpha/beta hydrolase [Desulfovibrio sp.]MBI4961262.1 alpha/beta hydrolase [Desulfovibrio sp.]